MGTKVVIVIGQSLINKFFILRQSVGHGQVMLSRGRVVARVDEMFPVYLCEVWAHDETMLTARSQIIVTLEDLKAAFLFDDEAIWQEHFRDIITQLDRVRADAEVRARAARKPRRRAGVDPAPVRDGVELVALDEDQMKQLLDKLRQAGYGEADQ